MRAGKQEKMTFGVYVHVPFCLKRCGYCDFNTYTAMDMGGGASRGNYANKVIEELQAVHAWQLAHGVQEPPVATVFFGGGTPTVLSAVDLTAIVAHIESLWGLQPGAEITTEANPDTVDDAYVDALAQGGFTRVSFGMQSAVPHVLRTLDRTHTPANVTAGVAAAQAAGLRCSVDLIYGTPGESLDDWRTSLNAALELGVRHISAYALSVEPGTLMGRRIAAGTLPKPDDDDEATKYEIADAMFAEQGLDWYEISNWAVPGEESRHNLGYWRNGDWAGIGPGAHSHYARVLDEQGNPQEVRSWDVKHPRLWGVALSEGRVPWADSETIGEQERLEETLMLGLRLREGFDTSRCLGLVDGHVWRELADEGLITLTDGRAVPTLRGRLLNDAMVTRLLTSAE